MTETMSRDDRILQLLFDPESAPMPPLNLGSKENSSIQPEALRRSKVLEREAVKAAEGGLTSEGLRLLETAIQITPEYASLYNNRAQIHRIRNEVAFALEDATQAIELATPVPASRPISSNDAKVLSQAYAQRATLFRLYLPPSTPSRTKGQRSPPIRPEMIEGWSRERLLEASTEDLEMGARYGNEFAKAVRVAQNPYARMCAGIVKTAMRGEQITA